MHIYRWTSRHWWKMIYATRVLVCISSANAAVSVVATVCWRVHSPTNRHSHNRRCRHRHRRHGRGRRAPHCRGRVVRLSAAGRWRHGANPSSIVATKSLGGSSGRGGEPPPIETAARKQRTPSHLTTLRVGRIHRNRSAGYGTVFGHRFFGRDSISTRPPHGFFSLAPAPPLDRSVSVAPLVCAHGDDNNNNNSDLYKSGRSPYSTPVPNRTAAEATATAANLTIAR